MRKISCVLLAVLICSLSSRADELVYQDAKGTVRWRSDRTEVRLFGANYCLPSACDYRAAQMVGGNHKSMIDQDMVHFSRMGWDALRLSYWGDWVGCDSEGNLLENEHLDLLDYLIYRASERGIGMLLSPIVTYEASWPDRYGNMEMPGFSAHYRKDELITNPKAIEAECNYLRQLLNHVNPYTGRRIADEPYILFVELINEPAQMPKLEKETLECIETLSDAVRSTGCKKLLYYNITQDCDIIPIVRKSGVDGGTYAWYPGALNNNRTLPGNFLPFVSDYDENAFDIGRLSRLVYEFDATDVSCSYMLPAMVREYRKGKVQFAAMFSYDMLETAPWNLGWQTHLLNMVYTPRKAAGAIIAAEAMRRLPSGVDYGPYPDDNVFGDFMVDHERDLAVVNAPDVLMYSNDIMDMKPSDVGALERVVGIGSSAVVSSDGNGLYFLDKIRDGLWRLELHPNIVTLDDPFKMPSPTRRCFAVADDRIAMSVRIDDLGGSFSIKSVDGKETIAKAFDCAFTLGPGAYLLSADGNDATGLPETVNGIRMDEYVTAAPSMPSEPVCIHEERKEYVAGEKISIACEIAWDRNPEEVSLFYTTYPGTRMRKIPMQKTGIRKYSVELPSVDNPATLKYMIGVRGDGHETLFPSGVSAFPDEWDYTPVAGFSGKIVKGTSPLKLFVSEESAHELLFTRIFRSLEYRHRLIYDDCGDVCIEMTCDGMMPSENYSFPLDLSVSSWAADAIEPRLEAGFVPESVTVELQGLTPSTTSVLIVFQQSDCRSWSMEIPATTEMASVRMPLSSLRPDKAPMMPQDWPGVNPYWYPQVSAEGQSVDWSKVEHCIVSMRDELYENPEEPKGFVLKSVYLNF